METLELPIEVSERTRLATAKARESNASSHGMDRAHAPGHRVSFFYLAQNLRLAHHHGIQAGSHAEYVAHRFALLKFIDMRIERRGATPK